MSTAANTDNNRYSDLVNQEFSGHSMYTQRPDFISKSSVWSQHSSAPSDYTNNNSKNTFLPNLPTITNNNNHHNSTPCHYSQQNPMENNNSSTEFIRLSPPSVSYHSRPIYSPSPPLRYRDREDSASSDSSKTTPHTEYNKLQHHQPRSPRDNEAFKQISSRRDNALERNRQAALRCRQRKKEWLNQLQSNVETLTKENRVLEQQSLSLREEILTLKTILLAHRDCSHAHVTAASLNTDNLFYRRSNTTSPSPSL